MTDAWSISNPFITKSQSSSYLCAATVNAGTASTSNANTIYELAVWSWVGNEVTTGGTGRAGYFRVNCDATFTTVGLTQPITLSLYEDYTGVAWVDKVTVRTGEFGSAHIDIAYSWNGAIVYAPTFRMRFSQEKGQTTDVTYTFNITFYPAAVPIIYPTFNL